MKNEQLAAQAQLAADILRTGHPWEYKLTDSIGWQTALDISSPIYMIQCENEIRLALATPGDGRKLHNPDNLTAEQVGAGLRLLLESERFNDDAEFWHSKEKKWFECRGDIQGENETYRKSLSTPWLEAKVELKAVPLEARDVLPGSWICENERGNASQRSGIMEQILLISQTEVSFATQYGHLASISYGGLQERWQINKSIPLTGKWDADAWEKCEKEAV